MAKRAFTLVEILVVIAILGLLMGVLVVGLGSARRNAKVRATKLFLSQIRSALSSYYNDFGTYPPTSVEKLGVEPSNKLNLGIEALVACLFTQQKSGPYLRDYKPKQLQNYDNDKMPNFNDSANRSGEAFELVDDWKNPFVYIHSPDYENPWRYKNARKEYTVKALLDPKTKNFLKPYGFQIWSLGPNGKSDGGKGDDILGW